MDKEKNIREIFTDSEMETLEFALRCAREELVFYLKAEEEESEQILKDIESIKEKLHIR